MTMTSAKSTTPTARPAPAINGARQRSAAETLARTTTKRVVRGYGMATGDFRPPPDFLIVGAKGDRRFVVERDAPPTDERGNRVP